MGGLALILVVVCLRGAYVTGEFHYGIWGGVTSCIIALLLPIMTLWSWSKTEESGK